MKIRQLPLEQAEDAHDVAVVIDVLRAFTTAAIAFERGASEILLVAEVAEALKLQEQFPGSLTLGEVRGRPIPEFNFCNSPYKMSKAELQGKRMIHRSSSGTQGVVRAKHAKHLFAGAFSSAAATARCIVAQNPEEVDLIVTGIYDDIKGEEDVAYADYLSELLQGNNPDPAPYIERVLTCPAGQRFLSGERPFLPPQDLQFAVEVNRFNFAMPITRRDGLLVMRAERY